MKRKQPLAQLLRDAGRELEATQPPPAVWAGVAAALAGTPAPAPRWQPLAWSGAAACALVLLGSVLLMLQPPAAPQQPRSSGFVPLLPTEHWGDEPTWLVDAEMPAERLVALGLPYDPARAGERVRAELLLRASGEVLAVRFVR